MTSPYYKLYHQPPSYLHLKICGCLCYPWTAYSRAHKFDPKSFLCIFISYSSKHKGFRCFDPATSKLIISRHVRFHEHEFPMANPTHPTPPPQISTIHTPLSPLFAQPSIHHLQPPTLSPTSLPPPSIDHHLSLLAKPTPTSNTNADALPPPPSPHLYRHLHFPYPRYPPTIPLLSLPQYPLFSNPSLPLLPRQTAHYPLTQ